MKHSKIFLFSLALLYCLFIQASYAQTFPSSVTKHMATRNMRYHHYMWHQIRSNWNKFTDATKASFKKIGWEPPNPSRDAAGKSISTNYAGEDFLYMHRQMIATAKQVATQNKQSTSAFTGWTTIPAPGDKTYPVPPTFTVGSTPNYYAEYKTDAHYQTMKTQETQLKDPARLKKMTLNELGYKIEGSIHNSLHYRWTNASSYGYRSGGAVSTQTPNISKTWDDPKYDWMGDSYASHVNPLFWRLHGWVDDRVEDWRKANGLSSIKWTGTWTGGPMANLGNVLKKGMGGMQDMASDDPEAVGDVLEEAFELFMSSGIPETDIGGEMMWKSGPKKGPKICKKKRHLTVL